MPIEPKPEPSATEDLTDLNLVPGGSDRPPDPESASALDALLKEATGEDTGTPTPTDEEIKAKADADAETKRLADEAAAAAAAEKGKTPTADEIKAKADADAATEEKRVAAEKAKAPTDLDKIELPPYTKPKAAEAFAQVKLLAKQQVESLTKELETVRVKLVETEAKVKDVPAVAPEIEKELKELREFRQKMDVEADPAFKEWDGKIKANEEAIYARLKASGLDDAAIAKVKELGGPAEVNWEALAEKLPGSVKRYLEGKLFENESLADQKAAAIAKAKANSAEYLKSRENSVGKSEEASRAATTAEVKKLLPQMGWLKPKQAGDKATPEEKKAVEDHNAFIKTMTDDIEALSVDNSPETRALLTIGYAQLKRARVDLEALKVTSKATEERLTKELTEAKGLIAGIKKSSTTRLRESAAPDPGTVRKTANISEAPGDALDRLRAEAEAKAE